MTNKKRSTKKNKATLLSKGNNYRYKQIRQKLENLNILNKLVPFNTRKYSPKDYFTVLEQASIQEISIKQTCLMSRLQNRSCPSPEQVMKCCRSNSLETMTNFINTTLKEQFYVLPKNIQQQLKKAGTLIIDFHQDPYYGVKDNPDVRKGKLKKSTNLFYEYFTADLYCKTGCFTIAIFHRTPGENIFSLTKRLLEHVKETLNLKIIIFDGEFPAIDVLNFLQQNDIKFLGRKSRTNKVKEHLKEYYGENDWQKKRKWRPIELFSNLSQSKKIRVDICPQNVRGEIKTLIKTSGWSITPKYGDKLYKKRFNIETGFRDKHKFQIFTCTKILSTRLLFFLIACIQWNCWQGFLIWVRSLKSYSKSLPRTFIVQTSATWFKFYLINTLNHSRGDNFLKEVM